MVVYSIEKHLNPEEFKSILIRSTLGERRPINDDERIKQMVETANLIVTARVDGKLIGVSRSLTDFSFCTYLSDLAVDEKHQKQGIGKELIKQTKLAAPAATLILLSAPKAIGYYPKIGMTRHENCFLIHDIAELQ
jgi:GNAT superfamily N-acetyltransferase